MSRVKITSSIDFDSYKKYKKSINSSVVTQADVVDYVAEGYKPDFGWIKDNNKTIGILASYRNEPVAYMDRPTLNKMYFSPEWADYCVLNNPFVKAQIEMGCYWMSDFHRDSETVEFPEIAGRITEQHLSEDGTMIIGSYDILDTPLGRQIYLISKIAPIGTSTRGWGSLTQPDKNGVRSVVVKDYLHVCSDFVTFPAVPPAMVSSLEQDVQSETLDQFYEELKQMLDSRVSRFPSDPGLKAIASMLKGDSSIVEEHKNFRISKAEVSKLLNKRFPRKK